MKDLAVRTSRCPEHQKQDLCFIDPINKHPLHVDAEGNLVGGPAGQETVYRSNDGCYNFAAELTDNSEQQHYDAHYGRGSRRAPDVEEDIVAPWFDPCIPWYTALLRSLGDLSGKKILLVGNGRSCKEFYFVQCGAEVIYTDLSFEGVRRSKEEFERLGNFANGKGGAIQFHAVDAFHLPFCDDSIDIVYGCAFVHHLDNFAPFFAEVHRVLKKGGICRFLDQADSGLWSSLKNTVLRPVQLYSYWKHPRSPEDIKANVRGGFNRPNLLKHMTDQGFTELCFDRRSFFLAIGLRHYGKEVKWNKRAMKIGRPFFHFLRLLDTLSGWCHRVSDNRLMLVWGFTKP